ncbi:MAG: DNA polymerase III subunit epsilon [Eggerthellaceae bacterium]|nr:DNA polymerase III subunit epsilon [Eggerthellaceae bacterium]
MSTDITSFVTDGTPDDIIKRYEQLPQLANDSDLGEYDQNIVVIDTETTGVSFKKDELTQIAAARMEHGEVTDWFVTFVDPGMHIPDEISHLTNIYDADVANASSPEEALAQLVEFAGDAKMVAHNAAFDKEFTTKHPAGYPLLENTWIDSLELSRIALPRMKSHRLIDLVRAFGAPVSTHRADDDVAALCAVYRILLAAISSMPEGLLFAISQLASPEEWPTQVLFANFANMAYEKRAKGNADPVAPEHLSLHELRRARLPKEQRRRKKDAADMVSAELLEQLQNSNMHVEADAQDMKVLSFPTSEDIADAFTAEGLVGGLYAGYEARAEQSEMACAVRDAFAGSVNLCVEAGTGVGKSMAYLVPAALTARANDISVGVATKTNALLDQLVYKELPLLKRALGGELTYAPIKGFSHYPCLRKVQRMVDSGAQMRLVMNDEQSQAPAIAGVLSFIEQTAYDDMDTLKVDFRVLPRGAISTTSHDCLRRKCPFFGQQCFVFGSRKLAEEADVVVTNQSLLFCDVAAEGGLLPPIRYWVVDEAHGAEAEARGALSLEIGVEALNHLTQRVSSDSGSRNVFTRAERNVDVGEAPDAARHERIMKAEADEAAADGGEGSQQFTAAQTAGTLFFALTTKGKTCGRAFAEAEGNFMQRARDLLEFDPNRKSSYDMTDIWINEQVRATQVFAGVKAAAEEFIGAAEALINACQELVGFLDDYESASVIQREIAAVALELKDMIAAADVIFVHPTDEYVCSANLSRHPEKGRGVRNDCLRAMLFNVGGALDETLYADTRSVVYTSATLTVNGSFQPFEDAMGLNSSEQSRANTLTLKSSYDFDANMAVYVVNDMPEPGNPSYLGRLQELLAQAHVANGGSMLTLFTNKKEMDACFAEVQPRMKEHDLRLVCQKWGVSTKNLRDDFLKDESLSLFALKSFWEGFDAPGDTLKGVIIPKLPFAKPTDPLSCERSARDDAAWRNYVLPQAVLEVRQAAGRLIRSATDTGILILADSRLVSKGYGKVFLRSLPSQNVSFVTAQELADILASKPLG